MKRTRPLFAASVILALAALLPVAVFSVEPTEAPEPSWDTSSTIVDVNGDPDALAAVCARIAAGEVVEEWLVYDCSAFPAFKTVCDDPDRATGDCLPSATPVTDTCWDCAGSTMTAKEKHAAACSAEIIQKYPSMLATCFPEKWAWVCFSEDPMRNIQAHCEMYRRDLDPLGIFTTPPPMPTPEPLPTPVPTATPDHTPVPDPEMPATATP